MNSATLVVSPKTISLPKAILWGGLIAGVLDAIDGVVAFGLKGLNPIQPKVFPTTAAPGTARRPWPKSCSSRCQKIGPLFP